MNRRIGLLFVLVGLAHVGCCTAVERTGGWVPTEVVGEIPDTQRLLPHPTPVGAIGGGIWSDGTISPHTCVVRIDAEGKAIREDSLPLEPIGDSEKPSFRRTVVRQYSMSSHADVRFSIMAKAGVKFESDGTYLFHIEVLEGMVLKGGQDYAERAATEGEPNCQVKSRRACGIGYLRGLYRIRITRWKLNNYSGEAALEVFDIGEGEVKASYKASYKESLEGYYLADFGQYSRLRTSCILPENQRAEGRKVGIICSNAGKTLGACLKEHRDVDRFFSQGIYNAYDEPLPELLLDD